ncbi:MAG: hypothetical protein V1904_11830 [Bacteroidota bacterium]
MRSYFYSISFKTGISIITLLLVMNFSVLAEGTKEFRPDSAYYGNMQINDLGRPFALESNTDSLYRLYFHIKDHTKEYVYVGFKHINVSGETATWRIKDPNGNVVRNRASIPVSGSGYIKYYSQAVVGPRISLLPANGYQPLVFDPVMNGDFYIEFTTTLQGTSTAYHFDLFDLTVATTTTNRIKGRLWSYCWDLNTRSYTNRCWSKFYSYSTDGFVTQFDMNGIQPYGFTVACNNSGPTPTERKSVNGNSTRPQYKVFLNDPDPIVYPSGEIPIILQNLVLVDTPFVGQPAKFALKMSQSGTVEMVIELNGTPGYQPNTEDIIIIKDVVANQSDTIVWDGIDGLGHQVDADGIVVSSADFYSGITHFPLYDPETNDQGYIVNRIRPVAGPCKIYWDDSDFSGGTTNVEGQYGPAHTWPYFFGDVRTMNTWWDGYRIDTMARFTWNFKDDPMPIELLSFNAKEKDDNVILNWSTASEVNNDFFTIENSENGIDFNTIGYIEGSGNSNSVLDYNFVDENPYKISFYRLKQTDYDGGYTYSQIIKVSLNETSNGEIIIIAANGEIKVMTSDTENGQLQVNVYTLSGTLLFINSINVEDGSNTIKIKPDIEGNSIYLVSVSLNGQQPVNTKVYMN